MSTELGEFSEIFNIHVRGPSDYIMQSGHNCGAMIIVTRETGLIAPGKKNIYNATLCHGGQPVQLKLYS